MNMMMKTYKNVSDKIHKLTGLNNKMVIIFVIGIIGILLILLSEIIPSSNNSKNVTSNDSSSVSGLSNSEFKNNLEKELKGILERIEGVGNVSILISLDGTTEYVYAQNLDTSNEEKENDTNSKYKNEVVIVDDNSNEKPLIKKIIEPKITGVMVVCSGGGDISIKERVINAVSKALNISSNNVCVEKG